jgi:hypothetical protein
MGKGQRAHPPFNFNSLLITKCRMRCGGGQRITLSTKARCLGFCGWGDAFCCAETHPTFNWLRLIGYLYESNQMPNLRGIVDQRIGSIGKSGHDALGYLAPILHLAIGKF